MLSEMGEDLFVFVHIGNMCMHAYCIISGIVGSSVTLSHFDKSTESLALRRVLLCDVVTSSSNSSSRIYL